VALVVAALLGISAAIATYDLSRVGQHTPTRNDESDPGLTP
jgi:hypothetical protein